MGPRESHRLCRDDPRVPRVHQEHGQRPLHTKVSVSLSVCITVMTMMNVIVKMMMIEWQDILIQNQTER